MTTGAVSHSAVRLATAIVTAISSPEDYPTLAAWGRASTPAVSVGGLKVWCQTAGALPSDARDFSRILRTLHIAMETGWRPTDFLDIVNPRTLDRLLTRGGVTFLKAKPCPVEEFCLRQRFLASSDIVAAVLRLLQLAQGRAGATGTE